MRSHLTDQLTAADPARTVGNHIPDGVWLELADDIMKDAPIATAPDPVSTSVAIPNRHRARRVAVILVAAAALIAAPVGFNLTGRPSGASVAAAGVLDRAAIKAVDPAAKPEQYWKITSTGGSMAGTTETRGGVEVTANWWVSSTTISYVAVDGSRPTFTDSRGGDVQRQINGPPGVGRTAPSASIDTATLTPNDLPGGWQTPNRVFFDRLPRDVTALRERLYADADGHGQSTDGEVLVLVADVLRSGLVPADLRAALYRVLKTVPDVEVTANAVTIQGRTGVALARTETVDGARQEIIIDPQSGLLIGERSVILESSIGQAVGTVLDETGVTRTLVDEVPAQIRARAHLSVCSVDADNGTTCSVDDVAEPSVG